MQTRRAFPPCARCGIRDHGFGRAIVCGIDHSRGDAVVIMMADESDDCRDVVRYWKLLGKAGTRFSDRASSAAAE
jgi:glycosyltransferase involved in cell wall biosynthesis